MEMMANNKDDDNINSNDGEAEKKEKHVDNDDEEIQLIKSKSEPNLCPNSLSSKDVQDGIGTAKERVLERLNTTDNMGGGRRDLETNVHVEGMWIACPGRPEIALSHPFLSSPKACLFTLKEGTKYKLKFSVVVSNNVVSGLKYEHTLWKSGIRLDKSTVKLGSFSPQEEPHAIELDEDTIPAGCLFRGVYSARAKVIDDDGKCYMDLHYHFEIHKHWPSNS